MNEDDLYAYYNDELESLENRKIRSCGKEWRWRRRRWRKRRCMKYINNFENVFEQDLVRIYELTTKVLVVDCPSQMTLIFIVIH